MDANPDGFKTQYFYVKLEQAAVPSSDQPKRQTDIPRGGAYWSQDILEAIATYQIDWFLPNMPQRVGVCIPSGCTVEDADTNYKMIYENIGAKFTPQTGAQPSLTEDYFYEGYLQGNEYDGYYDITPDAWTWGQWCYV